MKYDFGLISYQGITYPNSNKINLGDYVQSVAARQFLPKVDQYISREKLNIYEGAPIKMIMNAWYMANPENFPPAPQIDPKYVSIHINSSVKEGLTSPTAIAHFKKHEPIGCRDNYTRDLLTAKGVDAYYSGCMTLTLGETYKRDNPGEEIYIIDPMFDSLTTSELLAQPLRLGKRILNGRVKERTWRTDILKKYFDKEVLDKAIYLSQIIEDVPVEEGFRLADEYLKKLVNAKLVITSRIHCALPCLAMGTPVIFINGGFSAEVDNCRFDGLNDFFNRIDVEKGTGKSKTTFELEGQVGYSTKITNLKLHEPYAERLIKECREFINGHA